MKTNRQIRQANILRDRQNSQDAPVAIKALWRLDRQIRSRRQALNAYEGYTIHGRNHILVHMQQGGQRKTIEITPMGAMRRYPRPCITVAELMNDAR